MYYYNARYYDPEIGRFTREDDYQGDIRRPQTLNLYVYVLNNGMRYVDPTGHTSQPSYESEYVIQPGDNLSRISMRYYGTPNRYAFIANYNNIKNPDLIYPGHTLRIPSILSQSPANRVTLQSVPIESSERRLYTYTYRDPQQGIERVEVRGAEYMNIMTTRRTLSVKDFTLENQGNKVTSGRRVLSNNTVFGIGVRNGTFDSRLFIDYNRREGKEELSIRDYFNFQSSDQILAGRKYVINMVGPENDQKTIEGLPEPRVLTPGSSNPLNDYEPYMVEIPEGYVVTAIELHVHFLFENSFFGFREKAYSIDFPNYLSGDFHSDLPLDLTASEDQVFNLE